jgi:hypothetical protein
LDEHRVALEDRDFMLVKARNAMESLQADVEVARAHAVDQLRHIQADHNRQITLLMGNGTRLLLPIDVPFVPPTPLVKPSYCCVIDDNSPC